MRDCSDTYTSSKSLIDVAGVNTSSRPMIYTNKQTQTLLTKHRTNCPTVITCSTHSTLLHIVYVLQEGTSCIVTKCISFMSQHRLLTKV